MSKIIFAQYKEVKNNAYFFKTGIYNSIDEMEKDTYKYNNYIYVKEKNKYHVYLAITKNNKEKLKNYFDSIGIKTSVEEKEVSESFLNFLKDTDSKMNDTNIKDIISETLKKYGEIDDKD